MNSILMEKNPDSKHVKKKNKKYPKKWKNSQNLDKKTKKVTKKALFYLSY